MWRWVSDQGAVCCTRSFRKRCSNYGPPPHPSRGVALLALSCAIRSKWEIELGDVSTAFLQGVDLVWLQEGALFWGLAQDQVPVLHKTVCGLKHVPLLRYKAFLKAARVLLGNVHVPEEGLVRWEVEGIPYGLPVGASPTGEKPESAPLKILAVVNVDDFIFAGTKVFYQQYSS